MASSYVPVECNDCLAFISLDQDTSSRCSKHQGGFDYEYTFNIDGDDVIFKDPKTGDIKMSWFYQETIKLLGIEDGIYEGQKMSKGGFPQAMFLKRILERTTLKKEQKSLEVTIYFNGNIVG